MSNTPSGKVTNKEQSANITSREQLLTIPAKTVVDLDFLDTYPNYVYVNNYSGSTLYFGRSVLPSNTVYDMVISGLADNLYASPNSFRSAYLYNDGADVVNCKVTSFVAPFEPAALKGGGGTATQTTGGTGGTTGTQTVSGNVNSTIVGYDVPLPSGSNMIGHVVVDSQPAVTVTQGALAAGTNHIGSVAIDQMAPLAEGTSNIGNVGIVGGVTITSMPPMQVSSTPVATAHQMWEGSVGQTTVNFVFANSATINDINFIKNDGTTDLYVSFDSVDPSVAANQASGLNGAIRLAAGESISDFGRKCSQVNFYRATGTGNARFLGA